MNILVIIALLCVAILSVWVLIYMLRKWRQEDEWSRTKGLMPGGSPKVRTRIMDEDIQRAWNEAHENSSPSFEQWEASQLPKLSEENEILKEIRESIH